MRTAKDGTSLMSNSIYLGTSGWAYPAWKPEFYPKKVPAKKFLDYYATRLNAVEVNYTFRQFPAEKTLCNWVDSVPKDFRFAVKANQRITHFQKLRNAADVTTAFLRALQPLFEAGKLGPVLFQLPPDMNCDLPLLREFLTCLPKSYLYAFEFRNESWFADEVFATLREFKTAICVADSEKIVTPDVETAAFSYYRFRQPEGYSAKQLSEITEKFKAKLARQEIFAFFKHEETPQGAVQAEQVLKAFHPAREAEQKVLWA